MEDDAQGVATSATQSAYHVPHVDALDAARALHRRLAHRENDTLALAQRRDLDA